MIYDKYSPEKLIKLLKDKDVEIKLKQAEITTRKTEIATHKEEIATHKEEIKEYQQQIEKLEEVIALLKEQLFGSSSEKRSSAPKDHLLDEVSNPSDEEKKEIEDADEEIVVSSYTRKKNKAKGGRKPLPQDLPIIEKTYEIDEEERKCKCGCILQHIKDEITEQLEIIPAQLYVVRHIKKKYGNCPNKCDSTIKLATMPKPPLPKSIAAPGLLAHVIVAKYQDHLPLYRQEQILQRLGIDIPRQTISHWVLKAYKLLIPLYNLLRKNIVSYDVAFADETTLQVIKEEGKKAQSKSYMWVIGGGEPKNFSYLFKYSASRSHEILFELLNEFRGYLHCDGYSGYDAFVNRQAKKEIEVTQVGCWYHARRKFVEVAKVSKNKGIAAWVIDKIAKLSKIEADIKCEVAEQRYTIRQEKALPILEEIKKKLEESQPTVPEKSKLGEAIFYTLNQWHKLINYTKNGRLEISNNSTESQIRPFATGRKNWMFSFCVDGAICSALYFSFQATCKYHGVNFYLWLKYVFTVIQEYPKEKLVELLPYNIDNDLLEEAGRIPKLKFEDSEVKVNDSS